MNVLQWFGDLPNWIAAATAVCTSATAITMLTKSTSDDKILNKVLWVLNILAGNIAKNTNKQ
tara:strand:+ start:266 stop:451 length:186 start_codon:yes stop_codon:yes gene_type:complete